MNLYEINKSLINKFGYKNQLLKFIEEITELLIALNNGNRENIIEELADVDIMRNQLDMIFNKIIQDNKIFYSEITEARNKKINKIEGLYLYETN